MMPSVITHPNDRGIIEIRGKELDIDSSRHKHQFEVRSPLNKSSQDSQEEVPMDVPLMNLIHNNHIVPREVRVRGHLTKKETLSEEENPCS